MIYQDKISKITENENGKTRKSRTLEKYKKGFCSGTSKKGGQRLRELVLLGKKSLSTK